MLVYDPLDGTTATYIAGMKQPVTRIQRHISLRSAVSNDLDLARFRLQFGEESVSPAVLLWNSVASRNSFKKKIPENLYDLQRKTVRRLYHLKTHNFSVFDCTAAIFIVSNNNNML